MRIWECMPIFNRALRIMNIKLLVYKMTGRVEPWQEKFLDSGGRMVLINDCLTDVCMYVMGFYLLQDGAHEKLDKVRSC